MTAAPTSAELLAMITKLQADNAALTSKLTQASAPRAITMKVSEKGALSIYGLGRFPVTLYRGQWERLLNSSKDIFDFIDRNAALLAVKP